MDKFYKNKFLETKEKDEVRKKSSPSCPEEKRASSHDVMTPTTTSDHIQTAGSEADTEASSFGHQLNTEPGHQIAPIATESSEQISQLKDERDKLQDKVEELSKQLDDTMREWDQQQRMNREKQKDSHANDIQLHHDLEYYKERTEELSETVQARDAKIAKLSKQLEEETEDYNATIEGMRKEERSLQEQFNEKSRKLEELEQVDKNKGGEVSKLQSEIRKKEEEIKNLQQQVELKNSFNRDLEEKNRKLETNVQEQKGRAEEEARRIQSAQEELDSLKHKLTQKDEEIRRIRKDADFRDRHKDDVIESLRAETKRVKQEKDTEREQLEQKITTERNKIENLEKNNADLERQIQRIREDHSDELAQLKRRHAEELETKAYEVESAVKGRDQQYQRQLQSELHKLKEEREDLRAKVMDAESRATASSSAYDSRISQLQRDLEFAKSESERYRQEVTSHKQEIETLRKQKQSLQEKEKSLASDITTLQSQLQKSREKLSETLSDNNVQSLKTQVESLQIENRRLTLCIEDQTSEINRLKEDHSEAIKTIRDQSRNSIQTIVRNSVQQAEDRIRQEYSEELDSQKKKTKEFMYENEVLRRSIDNLKSEWSERLSEMKGREEAIREEGRREIDRLMSLNTQLVTLLQYHQASLANDQSTYPTYVSQSPRQQQQRNSWVGKTPQQQSVEPARTYLDQIEQQLKDLQTLGRSTLRSVSSPRNRNQRHSFEEYGDSKVQPSQQDISGVRPDFEGLDHPDYLQSTRRVNLSHGTWNLLGSPGGASKRVSFHETRPPPAMTQSLQSESVHGIDERTNNITAMSESRTASQPVSWYSPGYWQTKYAGSGYS